MKHNFSQILAAFSLFATMSLASCEKEAINYTHAPVSGMTQSFWTLSVGNIPEYDKEGGETAFSVTITSNIPSGELISESDDWISAAIADGTLSVSLQRNGTTELRSGTVTVKDTKGRVPSAVLRVDQDWSREGECYEVYHHTKGPGKVAIVFSGIGWIDVDINDGTFERIIHEGIEELKKQPEWKENWEYFDIYVYIHMTEKRCQWMYWDEMIGNEGPEEVALTKAYNEHRIALWEQMEKAVSNKYCYKITIDSHSNMMINSVVNNFPEWAHIVPVNGFDHKTEAYYNYETVKEAMTWKDFQIGEKNGWKDWKDYD